MGLRAVCTQQSWDPRVLGHSQLETILLLLLSQESLLRIRHVLSPRKGPRDTGRTREADLEVGMGADGTSC